MSPTIGFLVFPGVQQLDLTAPYEVFAAIPGSTMHLLWKDRQPVASSTGLVLQPTTTLADCPALDLLCVPGGAGINALLDDQAVLAFLRRQAATIRYLTAVCTGSLVLGAAGLLKGKRATTHWASHHLLAPLGAIPVQARVVRDGTLFTAGGVTAGMDFALTVAAEVAGRAQAEAIQLGLEYDPQPPFQAGTPAQASPEVVTTVRNRMAASRAEREALVHAIAAGV
ncbi:MAG: DJ-1/PfpI family protein [Bacteroidota bacterium]